MEKGCCIFDLAIRFSHKCLQVRASTHTAKTIAIEETGELQDTRASNKDPEAQDRDRAVRELVLTLPPKYRDVVVLFYFHEKDIPAAAKSLGLPEGTIKARLFRAREILRGQLSRVLSTQESKEG